MKKFTQKFFLLAMGLILSVGASAQTPTGAWNAFEDDGISHYNPTVLYKTSENGPIYIIPAWDKRITNNGYVRARKKDANGTKGMIVTAMGILYDANGFVEAKQLYGTNLWVWSEKEGETGGWIHLENQTAVESLHYSDIFNGGSTVNFVFKDSGDSGYGYGIAKKVSGKYTIPATVEWLASQGGGTGQIDEIGIWGYGNGNYSNSNANRSAITELTIPNTISKIGDYAFRGISTLKKVDVEERGSLTTIPERCFDVCQNLRTITLSSTITSIGGSAFGGCGNLNRMVFKTTTPPTFNKYNNTQDIFTTPLTNSELTNPSPETCVIEVPLGVVNAYVASNDGYLATKKFPLCSKFPLETSSGLMTYCSETDFTFKQYNTTSKGWEAGEMKTYYVMGRDVEIENGKVMLTEITDDVMVPGWKTGEGNDFGVVLKGTSGTTYDIFYPNGRGITTTFEAEDNCLHGCITATDVNAGTDKQHDFFIMSGGVFKRITKDGQCKANRAYIRIAGGPDIDGPETESKDLVLSFPGESTGITAHEVQSAQDDAWYTLQGIQVQQPSRGIFIKNGKKVVVK